MKLFVAFVLVMLVCGAQEGETSDSRNGVKGICKELEDELDNLSTITQNKIRQMNGIINQKHLNYKDANKPQAKEVIELNKVIQALTRKSQSIYSNRHYRKFCNLMEEEEKYGRIPEADLQKGILDLISLKHKLLEKDEENKQEL